MISRDDIHRNTFVSKFYKRFKRLYDNRLGYPVVGEYVAAMDDNINLFPPGGIQGEEVVREKIVASSAPLDPRMNRMIEAQVGVCKK